MQLNYHLEWDMMKMEKSFVFLFFKYIGYERKKELKSKHLDILD